MPKKRLIPKMENRSNFRQNELIFASGSLPPVPVQKLRRAFVDANHAESVLRAVQNVPDWIAKSRQRGLLRIDDLVKRREMFEQFVRDGQKDPHIEYELGIIKRLLGEI